MTYREEVVTLHERFPTWTSGQIAEFIGCAPETVRTIAKRNNLTFPPKKTVSIKRRFRKFKYAGWEAEGKGW